MRQSGASFYLGQPLLQWDAWIACGLAARYASAAATPAALCPAAGLPHEVAPAVNALQGIRFYSPGKVWVGDDDVSSFFHAMIQAAMTRRNLLKFLLSLPIAVSQAKELLTTGAPIEELKGTAWDLGGGRFLSLNRQVIGPARIYRITVAEDHGLLTCRVCREASEAVLLQVQVLPDCGFVWESIRGIDVPRGGKVLLGFANPMSDDPTCCMYYELI